MIAPHENPELAGDVPAKLVSSNLITDTIAHVFEALLPPERLLLQWVLNHHAAETGAVQDVPGERLANESEKIESLMLDLSETIAQKDVVDQALSEANRRIGSLRAAKDSLEEKITELLHTDTSLRNEIAQLKRELKAAEEIVARIRDEGGQESRPALEDPAENPVFEDVRGLAQAAPGEVTPEELKGSVKARGGVVQDAQPKLSAEDEHKLRYLVAPYRDLTPHEQVQLVRAFGEYEAGTRGVAKAVCLDLQLPLESVKKYYPLLGMQIHSFRQITTPAAKNEYIAELLKAFLSTNGVAA